MRLSTRFGSLILLALILAACTVGVPSSDPAVELESDFEIVVYQGGDALGGESVKFSQVLAQGRPVVLNMWAGLCPACRAEMPGLQRAHDEYGDEVLVLGIDVGPFIGLGAEADGQALLDDLAITFPAGTTPDAYVIRDYGVLGTPTTFFFTPGGALVQQWTGRMTEAQLDQAVQELLQVSGS
jgi:thiol-disulfide isomerase/thioredoxin